MTRFEWFQCCGIEGVELGEISPDRYQNYIRYCVFLDFKAQGMNNATAITLSADRNNCSERTVYRAVRHFDKSVSIKLVKPE